MKSLVFPFFRSILLRFLVGKNKSGALKCRKKLKKKRRGGEWGGGRGIIFVFTCIAVRQFF